MDTPRSLPLLTRGNAQPVAVFEALEPRAMLYSDLQIESIQLTPPGATYHPGENLDATVTVRALGLYGGFTANTKIAAILSEDTVWGNDDDLPAGEFTLWDNLTSRFPDGLVPIMFDWLVLPDSLQHAANTGDYRLGVRLDLGGQLNETDETNNTGWSDATIHLDTSTVMLPDLRVDRVTIPNPPAAFRVGDHVSISVDSKAIGYLRPGVNLQHEAVLSRDLIWGNEDDLRISYGSSSTDPIRARYGRSVFDTSLLPIPGEAVIDGHRYPAQTGSYHVGVRIDLGDSIAESIESNNIGWSDTTVFLDGTPLSPPPPPPPPPPPEVSDLVVRGRGFTIPDGRITASDADNTWFGTVRGDGRASTRIFRLTNPGTHALLIESVRISGRHPRDFVIVQDPGNGGTLGPGGRAILKVRFDPAGARLRKAIVTIRTKRPGQPRVHVRHQRASRTSGPDDGHADL